jgi:hypothetical protein
VNRAAVQVLIWAGWLSLLTIILWIWWGEILNTGELAAAAIVTALIAGGAALVARRPRAEEVRRLPEMSAGTVLIALALCGMLFGAEFGLFFVLICAELLAVGVAVLVRELRSERKRQD